MNDLTPELLAKPDVTIQVIEAAFGAVTREGGVSWSESRVIDDNGSQMERDAARAKDAESSWQALVDDERWDPEMGIGGWSFLDPVGFRYYLPAAMMRGLKTGYDVGIQFHLTLPKRFLREHTLTNWSLLDPGQRYAVARFIRTMIEIEEDSGDPINVANWRRTFASYWTSLPKLER
jgi:hypothetical protein